MVTCTVYGADGGAKNVGSWTDGTAATPARVAFAGSPMQLDVPSNPVCGGSPTFTATYATAGNDYTLT